jgi:enoyl-CoA hydratase/carnithine racemase
VTNFKYLKVNSDNLPILEVQFARPPANAVDRDMYMEIAELFSAPEKIASKAQVIILSAEGPHFCAGNDLDEFATMTPENGTERMWRVREAFFAIQDCPIPVIGAVHGVALGTGLAIAASCDFVVAAKDAKFGLPELTVGVMGGARHLARVAPQPLVRRMFFTGEHISAEDFLGAGGALTVCPDRDAMMKEARRLAARVAGYSPTAVHLAKGILNRIENMDLKSGYAFEQGYTVQMSGHPDSKEALKAFREKRAPNYLPYDGSGGTERKN